MENNRHNYAREKINEALKIAKQYAVFANVYYYFLTHIINIFITLIAGFIFIIGMKLTGNMLSNREQIILITFIYLGVWLTRDIIRLITGYEFKAIRQDYWNIENTKLRVDHLKILQKGLEQHNGDFIIQQWEVFKDIKHKYVEFVNTIKVVGDITTKEALQYKDKYDPAAGEAFFMVLTTLLMYKEDPVVFMGFENAVSRIETIRETMFEYPEFQMYTKELSD